MLRQKSETFKGCSPEITSHENLTEIQHLCERMSLAVSSIVRQRWRILAGFALAREYRTKLLLVTKRTSRHSTASVNPEGPASIEPASCLPLFSYASSSSVLVEDEVRTLRAQLADRDRLLACVQEAALLEIERLRALVAAESGDHAAAVHNAEERFKLSFDRIALRLGEAQQALSTLSGHYASLKSAYSELDSQLFGVRTRDADNRFALVKLTDRLALLNGQNQMASNRMSELESRLMWAVSQLPDPNQSTLIQQLALVNATNDKLVARVAYLNERVAGQDEQLKAAFSLLNSVVTQSKKQKNKISPHPTFHGSEILQFYPHDLKACPHLRAKIATMESSLSPADSVQSDSDVEAPATVCHTTAVSCDVTHTNGSMAHHKSACKNEATLSGMYFWYNRDRPLDGLASSDPDNVPNKTITKFSVVNGPHVPRFHRFYLQGSDEALRTISPVICHHPESDVVPKSSKLLSFQEAVSVRSIASNPNPFTSPQPHYVKLKHYSKTLPAPYSNCTNSNSLSLSSSVGVADAAHDVSSSVTFLPHYPPTSTIVTMTSSNLVAPQARLSKLGYKIKLGMKHVKTEMLPGRNGE
ncbi:hypothetical protein EG68_05205 [Paragonimus skrjabini miyazakii]|uniref:Uncharacterized protein n=1 Tax=Paragonimus skrjabini miyazakii TaxID=59628 RepID=A0A8S9YRD5_9TREM|nr:hypothetical protein EG68_05205 [Paragonimus skrjabini miyazakii]